MPGSEALLLPLVTRRRVVKWCLTWRNRTKRPPHSTAEWGELSAVEYWRVNYEPFIIIRLAGWHTSRPALFISIQPLRDDILPVNTPLAHYNAIILPRKNERSLLALFSIMCQLHGVSGKMTRYPGYNRVIFCPAAINFKTFFLHKHR